MLAIVTTVVVLAAFAVTTLVEEPSHRSGPWRGILALSVVLDLAWKHVRESRLTLGPKPAAGSS